MSNSCIPSLPPGVDWDFIAARKGVMLNGYVPRDADGNPDATSGVTIAVGFDLCRRPACLGARRRVDRSTNALSGASRGRCAKLSERQSADHHGGARERNQCRCIQHLLQCSHRQLQRGLRRNWFSEPRARRTNRRCQRCPSIRERTSRTRRPIFGSRSLDANGRPPITI